MSEYSGDGEVWMDTPDDHGGYTSDESWEEAMPASRLPDGTVVADDTKAWIKNHPTEWSQWRSTYGSHTNDAHIDGALAAGARVLRYGYGGGGRDE